jgi:hypothetical protein
VRILSLVLFVLAAIASLAALPLAPSPAKGRMRLFASLFVGAAFVICSTFDMSSGGKLWQRALVLAVGGSLAWAGLRKYRKDPLGHTKANHIL